MRAPGCGGSRGGTVVGVGFGRERLLVGRAGLGLVLHTDDRRRHGMGCTVYTHLEEVVGLDAVAAALDPGVVERLLRREARAGVDVCKERGKGGKRGGGVSQAIGRV